MNSINNDQKYLNAINTFEKFGVANLAKLKKHFLNFENCFFNKNSSELIKAGITEKNAQEFLQYLIKINPEEEFAKLHKENIQIVTPDDEDYPQLLQEIHHPPQILYYKGNIQKLNHALNIAIVGSRKFTLYGEQVCKRLCQELTGYNFNIISGLALGIDTISHTTALENNGYTVAILGTGLEKSAIYPRENKQLADDIIKNSGCLISEFPLNTKPLPFNFPQRNRIISGLAQATLVIEATQKSGTLITARLALENNRDVFAIPGNIYNLSSMGTNNLIRQGAIPVTDIQDILEHFQLATEKENTSNSQQKKQPSDSSPLY
jgi:DNA processing protein